MFLYIIIQSLKMCKRSRAAAKGRNVTMMKRTLAPLLLFVLLTLLLPLLAAALTPAAGGGAVVFSPASASAAANRAAPGALSAAADTVKLLDSGSGEVITMPLRDYLIGAAASELPISFQKEAFKAQIVAAHSYALASRDAQAAAPDAALKGAWFKAGPARHEGTILPAGLKALWGERYDANYTYVAALVDEVGGEVLLYDGKPAFAAYHAISNGKTETSEAVWGRALPYWVSVGSPLDATSPDYEKTVTLSAQDVYDKLNLAFLALDLRGKPSEWFGAPVRDAAGYIQTMPVGGQTLPGTELRAALGLRSADFDVAVGADNQFTFTTRGYGHGVGLSQYGANAMAVAGKTYREILAAYYPGTMLGSAS